MKERILIYIDFLGDLAFAIVVVVGISIVIGMLARCAPDLNELLGAIKCDVMIPEQEVSRDGPTVLKDVELKCRRGN